ncbi:MAG: pseudouridine synthase [Pontiellaceae bacterium]
MIEGFQRLSKIMASRGMCSRREADRYIERGLVTVNGVIIDQLGSKVSLDAEIELNTIAVKEQGRLSTFIINKPIGYVSSQPEDNHKPAVSLLNTQNRWTGDRVRNSFTTYQLKGIAPAGRLDIDSCGLLILTQDGRIAKQLIGEHSAIDKEYLVRVKGSLTDKDLKLLNYGLSLDGKKLKPAKVIWQNRDQLRFVLQEGKKRQIRRMCELVNLNVVGLKRIRIGKIILGKLPEGKWRYLSNHEKF